MRDLEWGKIAKLQDELVRQEEQRKKERQSYHKMLYKHELEAMMSEKNRTLRNETQSERKKYSESYRSLDHDRSDQERRSKLQIMVKENSDYNYNSNKNRRIRLRSELQEDQSLHRDKYRKAETERSEERQMESLQRMKRRRQLAQAYQEQMSTNCSRKHLQKLQNEKFEQLAQELESKREIDRQNHINKIKYGYSQNPEAYETIKQIYNKKQEVKQAFLRKLQIDKCPTEQSSFQKRSSETIETSNYNKNHFILREHHRKEQLARETDEESRKLSSLQEQLRLEMHHDRLLREAKRKQLKDDLESQMSEAAKKRLSWQKMDPNQHRINQSYLKLVQPISIPGLGRDHRDLKKEEIIDQFLKNKSTLSYAVQ